MGLASTALYNSALTNGALKLIPAVKVELLDTGYYAVVGSCGHRLDVVHKVRVSDWEARIAEGRRHRKRCYYCPR